DLRVQRTWTRVGIAVVQDDKQIVLSRWRGQLPGVQLGLAVPLIQVSMQAYTLIVGREQDGPVIQNGRGRRDRGDAARGACWLLSRQHPIVFTLGSGRIQG